jgi:hypothetical protein
MSTNRQITVLLTSQSGILAKDVASSLGIHPTCSIVGAWNTAKSHCLLIRL